MSTGDVRIADLFEAIGDALTLPPGASPDDEVWRHTLLGHRARAVCAALDHVKATGDPIEAIDLLDLGVEAHPITYTPLPLPRTGGGR
ncbi:MULTISPECIES: hypothetical protein [Nocardiopsis]|uniref:Uncharacterized protein n=1 Tax=Nocardiopsis lambiniae TaxID=3075539 RepID=A0ABU2MI44_9ACTN|nr:MULTISPECIES: hypothetical protein [unclassified Nocardiopsis]MDE3721220.1 hypothetical protein [Nocardiopsis sp. N85]MDT0331760.1 hypothetical protein [Nocardiopsis sp. DSM 44743]